MFDDPRGVSALDPRSTHALGNEEEIELPPGDWIPPEHLTDDEVDELWLRTIYKGDRMPQLTLRAIAVGLFIGAFMSLSNLYVGLKTGWGLGASITAVILAYAFFTTLQKFLKDSPHFNVLENNTMQTTASAAAYMSSAGLVSAIPALYMTTGTILEPWKLMLWMMAICMLGVMVAIPVKRQLINKERLPFPEGIACAETLRSMHGEGTKAMSQAKALLGSGAFGGIITFVKDGLGKIPSVFPIPGAIRGYDFSQLTVGIDGSTVMFAAGAIIGPRVGISLLIGGIFSYVIAAPILLEQGVIESASYRNIVGWSLWPGVTLMLTYAIVGLALQWRVFAKAFSGLGQAFGGGSTEVGVLDHIEIPNSYFAVGVAISGAACVLLQMWFFDIVWWTAILAVLLTFLLCVVAARATGETSITPVGPMGKLTQLMFGVLAPSNMTANLMSANVTAGASSQMADLMNDLKTGYLVGGSPRRQFVAQIIGVLTGAVFATGAYQLIVVAGIQRDPNFLGGQDLPAPAAQVWAKVAVLLATGLDSIPQSAQLAMLIAGSVGIAIALLEHFVPSSRRFLPSVMGLGIACTVPFSNTFSMFLGSVIAVVVAKAAPVFHERFTVIIASGLIAGETLAAVAVIAYQLL